MTKVKFYTIFSIFNIAIIALTLLYTLGIIILIGVLVLENFQAYLDILFLCGIVIYFAALVVKIVLPEILSKFGQKHKNSLLDKFLLYIKENPKEKIWILLLALIFDIFFLLSELCIYRDLFSILFGYIIVYLGGLFFFYLTLYNELETYK